MLGGSAAPCRAQSVRFEDRVFGGPIRAANQLAEEANLSLWPTLEEGSAGTQIQVTADYHNSDLVIRTFKSYGRDRLLALGKRLAAALDRPETDFIVSTGRGTVDKIADQAERELSDQGWRRVEPDIKFDARWISPRHVEQEWFDECICISDVGDGVVEVGVYTPTTPFERMLHLLGKR